MVIAHGASTAKAVSSACALAGNLARGDITEKIRERIGVTGERRPGTSAAATGGGNDSSSRVGRP